MPKHTILIARVGRRLAVAAEVRQNIWVWKLVSHLDIFAVVQDAVSRI